MRTDIEVREIEPAAQAVNRNTLAPRGPGPWEVFRISDGSSVAELGQTNRMAAEVEARRVIDQRGEAPELYGVRTQQPAAQEPQGTDTNVNYEIYNRETGEVVDTTQLRNDDEAQIRLDDYRAHGPHRLNTQDATRTFGIRRGPGVTNTQTDTNPLSPSGPGPWEVASRSNNQVYYNPPSSNPIEAESQSRTWLRQNDHNEADFEVRTREGVDGTDAAQGGIIDIGPDISQYNAPQTLTRPGQDQQTFTGEWRVMVDGEEVYRFSGVGNNQGDANRVGQNWILQQIRQGTLTPVEGVDVEVLPVMR
jgi:hypothetical protein